MTAFQALRHILPLTQGGAARLRRFALPWAGMWPAFQALAVWSRSLFGAVIDYASRQFKASERKVTILGEKSLPALGATGYASTGATFGLSISTGGASGTRNHRTDKAPVTNIKAVMPRAATRLH